MLTDADLDRLEKRLEKKFATKDDLKEFTSKDDFKSLHYQIEKSYTILSSRIGLLENKVDVFKNEFNEFKDKVYTHLDGFAGVIRRIDENHEGLSHLYRELRDRVGKL